MIRSLLVSDRSRRPFLQCALALALAALALGALAFGALGCGGGGAAPADMAAPDVALPPPLCTDPVPPDGGIPATFANVQQVFDGNCLYACHCCNGEVDLTAGHAWADLVGKTAPATGTPGDQACGTLIVPGDPTHSYLYQKLTQTKPCFGAQMPLSDIGSSTLPACQIDLLRRWIAAGAPND